MATSKEVLKYIGELGISKVQLRPEDSDSILQTLSDPGNESNRVLYGRGR